MTTTQGIELLIEIRDLLKGLHERFCVKEKIETKKKIDVPYKELVNLYNEMASNLSSATMATSQTGNRKTKLRARYIDDIYTIDNWKRYLKKIQSSKFLSGRVEQRNRRTFKLTLDFIIRKQRYIDIIEGKYDDE